MTSQEHTLWNERTARDRADKEALADPLWRLRWLYTIKDRQGRLIPFVPTPEQKEVICAVHVRGWRRILIPKARQLGISTVLALISLDFCLFNEGFAAALVDKKANDAEDKLRDKVRLAWDQLPESLRSHYDLPSGHAPEGIGWKLKESREAPSSFTAGISFRGGTVQLLWISEWGWIQANDAPRSKEILAGSLPASEKGITIVETTWEGGKGGDVWPLVEEALRPVAQKGPDSWRLLFFPWWSCPGYATEHGHEDEESRAMLDKHERALGLTFSCNQRLWYATTRRKLKRLMYSEYPSTLEECWHAPVPGSIYGPEMDALRVAGALGADLAVYRELPVFTFWDLGMSDSTVVLLAQPMGTRLHILDCHEAEGQAASYYVDLVTRWEREYKVITRHYLPHDAARRSLNDASSYQQTLARAGVTNTEVLPASHDVWWGINLVRDLLPRCLFHPRTMKPWRDAEGRERLSLVQCLEAYRKRTDPGANGAITESPVHDASSHAADAFRYLAEALARGVVPTQEKLGRDSRRDEFPHEHRRPKRYRMSVGG